MKQHYSKSDIHYYGKRNVLSRIKLNNEYIYVDYLMKDILEILNNKGYKTKFSCSGHNDSIYNTQIYIMFKNEIDFNTPLGFSISNECNRVLEPTWYVKMYDKYSKNNTYMLSRENFKKCLTKQKINTIKDLENYMYKYLNVLYNWANKLPLKKEDQKCFKR